MQLDAALSGLADATPLPYQRPFAEEIGLHGQRIL
jgi:hypothetical protein